MALPASFQPDPTPSPTSSTQGLPASFVPDAPGLASAPVANLPASFVPDTSSSVSPSTTTSLPASFVPDSPTSTSTSISSSEQQLNKAAPEVLPDEAIGRIATKYGVSPSELKQLAPYYGASVQSGSPGELAANVARTGAGVLGQGAALGLPQFLYKKMQDPSMRGALDEISKFGEEHTSTLNKVSEGMLLPGVGAESALAKTAAGRIATGAGIGAISGLTGSQEGQEAKSTATGAAIGTGIGAAAEAAVPALEKTGNWIKKVLGNTPEEIKLAESAGTKDAQVNLAKHIDQKQQDLAESESIIKNSIFTGQYPTPDELATIAQEQLSPYTLRDMEETLSRTGIEGGEGHLLAEAGADVLDSRLKGFAEKVTGEAPETVEDAQKALEDYYKSGTGGKDWAEKQYNLYQENEIAKMAQREQNLEVLGTDKFSTKAANFISDPQFVLQHLDNMGGTESRLAHEELNTNLNRMSYASLESRKDQDALIQAANKAGLTDAERSDPTLVFRAENGDLAGMTPGQQKYVKGVSDYLEKWRQFANNASEQTEGLTPLSIGKLSGDSGELYMPHRLKNPVELTRTVDNIVDNPSPVIQAVIGHPIDSLTQLTNQDVAKIATTHEMQALNFMGSMVDAPIENGRDIQTLVDKINSREGRASLTVRAKAAMERTGEMPALLRETDLMQLARGYTDNILNTLYLRQPVEQLKAEAAKMRMLGNDTGANYVERRLQNTLGVIPGSFRQEVNQLATAGSVAIDRIASRLSETNPIAGQAMMYAKQLPKMILAAQSQIYPNRLGWNTKIVLQHMLQVVTKTMPELGLYGPKGVAEGMTRFLMSPKYYAEEARKAGIIGAAFGRAGEQAIAEGIMRSGGWQGTASALAAISKFGMAALHGMVATTRGVVMATSETMARDIAAGDKLALRSLQNLPFQVQQEVMQNIENPRVAARTIAQHLNASTIYNYNKASMSDFGAYMGPLFSAFTKFPTATAGDIILQLRQKGILGAVPDVLVRYGAPLMGLAALQHAIMGDPDQMSPSQKKLIGSAGLAGMAPIESVKSMATGQLPSPPIVQAVVNNIVRPAISGQPSAVAKGISEFAKSYVPLAGPFRFLITDDLPTYLGEKK